MKGWISDRGCRWCPFRFLWQELVSCSQSLIIFLPPINTTSSHFLPFPSQLPPSLYLSPSSLVLLRFSLPLLLKRTKFRCTLWQPPKHGRFNKRELQILGFLKRGVEIPESRKGGEGSQRLERWFMDCARVWFTWKCTERNVWWVMRMMEKVKRVNSEKWSDEWMRLLRVLLYFYYNCTTLLWIEEYLWGQLTKAKQAIRKDDSSLSLTITT